MRNLILFIALLVSSGTFAQNIVSNGDFETFTNCPGWWDEIYECTGWKTATQTTPDYYNSCANGGMDVPVNFTGEQAAASGNGYGGIYPFNENSAWREYMSGTMSAMTAGSTYKVSMKVSLADGSKYAVNGLGVFFYENGVGTDTSHQHELFCNAQVDYTSYGFITDSTNWTTLTDTFVADSAYKNFMIGFFKDSTNNVMVVQPGNTWNSYYYIDDVSIEQIATASIAGPGMITGIQIAPVPITNKAILSFNNAQHKKHDLIIYDVTGKLLRKIEDITNSNVSIERDGLTTGCYFYELKCEDGNAAKGKLLVQ